MPGLYEMSIERFAILYQKYLSGSLTELKREEWLALLSDDELAPELEKSVEWFTVPQEQQIGLSQPKADAMVDTIVQYPQSMGKRVSVWPRIGIAAAVATIIVSAGIWFLKNPAQEKPGQQTAQFNDLAPGKVGATLTLANGKRIKLSEVADGEIAKEAGISVTKMADGELVYEIKETTGDPNKINTLSTAKGETYFLTLPDKSKVWLNAASSLTYAANLVQHGRRKVKLTGEAYLEVAKDKKHPFVVESKGQEVEVLGTRFNINAYAEESMVRTTLAEGSVKVTALGKSTLLKPNQQAVLSNGAIKVTEVDAELALAWKSGFFLFNRESLESVMATIARWYDVEVVYNDPSLKVKTFTGTISRFEKISQVFNMLERTGGVKFKRERNKITIDKMK